MDATRAGRPPGPLLARLVEVRAGEGRALALAFAYFFALLFGYYLLRPVREVMGIAGGVEQLHWVFTATFVVMLGAVPAYSALVARVPRARAVPWVYLFFAVNLLGFWTLLGAAVAPAWVARAFFVWVSVYNLFVVSVFWSLLADVFTSAEGRRLFGFVAAGGTAGQLCGSAFAALLAARVGNGGLLLLSAASLAASAWCAARLAAWGARRPGAGGAAPRPDAGAALGGSALAGLVAVFRSRYLAGIGAAILLFALGSTFLYFQQARIVRDAITDPEARTRLFAAVDLAVGVLALATQTLATGRIIGALGLPRALALLPAFSVLGFLAVAASPTLWTLAVVLGLRRALHFAVERPAREVLFTVVPREDKYKAKSFIDTFLYRGGDAASGWLHAGLAGLGLGLGALALSAVPFAAAGIAIALWLGTRARRLEGEVAA